MNRAGALLLAGLMLQGLAPVSVRAQTQPGMTEDACSSFKKSDAALNQVYRDVLKKHLADRVFTERFRAAQRAWVIFRDAELKALYPSQEPGAYGSALPMCECAELAQLTRERITQLDEWRSTTEGDVCAGSRS